MDPKLFDIQLVRKLSETMRKWIGLRYVRKRRGEIWKLIQKENEMLDDDEIKAKQKERERKWRKCESGCVRYGHFYYTKDIWDGSL